LKGARRPTKTVSVSNYGPCMSCLGFYCRTDLWKHVKGGAHFSKKDSEKSALHMGKQILLSLTTDISSDLEKIIQRTRIPELVQEIRSDWLIQKYGSMLIEKYSSAPNQDGHIREKLEKSSDYQLNRSKQEFTSSDFLDPIHFDYVNLKVHVLTGIACKTPSLTLKIGHSLKKCCDVLIGSFLQKNDLSGKLVITRAHTLTILTLN